MNYRIAVIAGDGIGPEVVSQAKAVLDRAAERFGFSLSYVPALLGGASIDRYGVPLTQETIEICRDADAVLMGSVGGDASVSPWYRLEPAKRPEAGLLGLRRALHLFANLRPAFLCEELKDACPLRREIAEKGFDLMIVRELTGGLYFGEKRTFLRDGSRTAVDTMEYSEAEIRRAAEKAFEIAEKRRGHVTSVDKANVLECSRLWRRVTEETAGCHPDVRLDHMLVDNCAMQLVRDPSQFDVILTGNMFGDILSDEASMMTGSIGLLPSASLGETNFGLYEPCHGSAPDIAGQDRANPIAAILSAAMMLRYSLEQPAAAQAIEDAVRRVLREGFRTDDIAAGMPGAQIVGCAGLGQLIAGQI